MAGSFQPSTAHWNRPQSRSTAMRARAARELLAPPAASLLGLDEEVLEVEARLAQESREIVEEKREGDHLTRVLGDQGLRGGTSAEEVPLQVVHRTDDLVLEAFVAGQVADEGVDPRHVFDAGSSNHGLLLPSVRGRGGRRSLAAGL